MIYCFVDDRVENSGATPLKLATTQTTEVITYAVHIRAHVGLTGRDGTTQGKCNAAVRSPWGNSWVLIRDIRFPLTRGNSGSLDVLNKRKSTSPSISRNNQKFDAFVDENFANDWYSMSIFSKVIGHKLSHSPRADIYLRCQMDFTSNAARTEAPSFMYLLLPSVNASSEFQQL